MGGCLIFQALHSGFSIFLNQLHQTTLRHRILPIPETLETEEYDYNELPIHT